VTWLLLHRCPLSQMLLGAAALTKLSQLQKLVVSGHVDLQRQQSVPECTARRCRLFPMHHHGIIMHPLTLQMATHQARQAFATFVT
jgi:heme oxygenase